MGAVASVEGISLLRLTSHISIIPFAVLASHRTFGQWEYAHKL